MSPELVSRGPATCCDRLMGPPPPRPPEPEEPPRARRGHRQHQPPGFRHGEREQVRRGIARDSRMTITSSAGLNFASAPVGLTMASLPRLAAATALTSRSIG
jgi:hypothetical protein